MTAVTHTPEVLFILLKTEACDITLYVPEKYHVVVLIIFLKLK